MSRVVLDASAVLAVLKDEPGAQEIIPLLGDCVICAVNFSEVLASMSRLAPDLSPVLADLRQVVRDVRPFDDSLALIAARLAGPTRPFGLSLGDRACLALAQQLGAPALTADRAWAGLDLGVEVILVRGAGA
jgi:PIN domain nuclease of toxin-antitoxin system